MIDHENPTVSPRRRRPMLLLAAAGLLGVGGALGAVVVATTRPAVTMAPAVPVAIRALSSDGIVTIRGRVAEVYGNKFVMADASGRALVDTGRRGEDGTLVKGGEPVTVQGRFDHGFVRAAFLIGADGKVKALGPLGRPPHDRDGPPRPPHGGDDRRAPPPAASVSTPTTVAPAPVGA